MNDAAPKDEGLPPLPLLEDTAAVAVTEGRLNEAVLLEGAGGLILLFEAGAGGRLNEPLFTGGEGGLTLLDVDTAAAAETDGLLELKPPDDGTGGAAAAAGLFIPGMGISAGQGSSYKGSRQQNPT